MAKLVVKKGQASIAPADDPAAGKQVLQDAGSNVQQGPANYAGRAKAVAPQTQVGLGSRTLRPAPTLPGRIPPSVTQPPPPRAMPQQAMDRAFNQRMAGSGNAYDLHRPPPNVQPLPDPAPWNPNPNGGPVDLGMPRQTVKQDLGSTTLKPATGLAGINTANYNASSQPPPSTPLPGVNRSSFHDAAGQSVAGALPTQGGDASNQTPVSWAKDRITGYKEGWDRNVLDPIGLPHPGNGAGGPMGGATDAVTDLMKNAGSILGGAAGGLASGFNDQTRQDIPGAYNSRPGEFSDLEDNNQLAKNLMDPNVQAAQEKAGQDQLRSDVDYQTDRNLRMQASNAAAGGRMGGGGTQAAYDSANKTVEDGQRKLIQDAFARKLAAGQLGSQISSDRAKQIYDILGSERLKATDAAALMAQLFGDVAQGAGGAAQGLIAGGK